MAGIEDECVVGNGYTLVAGLVEFFISCVAEF